MLFVSIPEREIEEWLPVPGLKNTEASTLGNIRSTYTGHNRTLHINNCGYLQATFKDCKGNVVTRFIHRVIALTLLGEGKHGWQVNHKDHCRTNNRLSNLEWMTASENSIAAAKHHHEYHKSRRKLNDDQVRELFRLRREEGFGVERLCRRFGMTKKCITAYIRGQVLSCSIRAGDGA